MIGCGEESKGNYLVSPNKLVISRCVWWKCNLFITFWDVLSKGNRLNIYDLGQTQHYSIIVYCDNMSNIVLHLSRQSRKNLLQHKWNISS